jgi:hypothetical protein
MQKEKVLQVFEIDDAAYQGTCTAIGLKNPADLTGQQIDRFSTVRDWMMSGECKNFKAATEKMKELDLSQAQARPVSAALTAGFERLEKLADKTLDEVIAMIQSEDAEAKRAALEVYRNRIVARINTPEYQAQIEAAFNGETIDADFLPVDRPGLPQSQP